MTVDRYIYINKVLEMRSFFKLTIFLLQRTFCAAGCVYVKQPDNSIFFRNVSNPAKEFKSLFNGYAPPFFKDSLRPCLMSVSLIYMLMFLTLANKIRFC